MDSIFHPTSTDSSYVSLWVTLLDNYMHECHFLGDDWTRFRKAVEGTSESKRASLVRQFIEKNIADKFVSTFGSGDVSFADLIPEESIDAFCDVLTTRLDPESLRYV